MHSLLPPLRYLAVIVLGLACRVAVQAQDIPTNNYKPLDFATVIPQMKAELATPLARYGLESIIQSLFEARVKIKPGGYEDKPDFSENFNAVFAVFRQHLNSPQFYRTNIEGSSELTATMQKALGENREANERFLSEARRAVPHLANVSFTTMQRSQIYFGLILADANQGTWKEAWDGSYIFPLCLLRR